jgi:hypothetical protein
MEKILRNPDSGSYPIRRAGRSSIPARSRGFHELLGTREDSSLTGHPEKGTGRQKGQMGNPGPNPREWSRGMA